MKICFLMYPWERIDPAIDSSLRLIHEAASRGHTVALTTPHHLTIRDCVTYASCIILKNNRKVPKQIPGFYKKAEFQKHKLPLAGFDCIFIRTSPPLDTLCLNFLDSIRNDVFIVNDIDGLRLANNKLYTASFQEKSFIPKTYVSKDREYLENILIESETGKMIMKPLTGSGGKGVIVVEKKAPQNARSLLDYYIGEGEKTNFVILQDYVAGAEKGDIRILMLNGEPIGSMRRVPRPNEIRSNVCNGGLVKKHILSPKEEKLCRAIGSKLVQDGIYFAGLDVIEGKLIEVNVLSPGGITRINVLDEVCLQRKVINFVEEVVETKESNLHRKSEYKKIIEDAEAI